MSADIALKFGSDSPLPKLHFGVFVGESTVMHQVYRMLEKVARTETSCVITGESGTGKELAAEVIHGESDRKKGPLVPVNCGAIPENLLESEFFGHKKGAFTGAVADHAGRFLMADGGTLFLDEIGEMELSLQVKLLRALQTGEIQPVGSSRTQKVNVRVVAATNRNLEEEMSNGNFREDLYYRLAIIPVELPTLRERPDDIPLLIRHAVERINTRAEQPVVGMTSSVLAALTAYRWPGNVRELSAVLERMIVLAESDILRLEDLPPRLLDGFEPLQETQFHPLADPMLPDEGLKLADAVDRYETTLILQALERTGWNKNQAAQLLKMNRTTLVEKLKKKNLSPETADVALRAAGE